MFFIQELFFSILRELPYQNKSFLLSVFRSACSMPVAALGSIFLLHATKSNQERRLYG
jgi:hypothetical protein